MSIDFASGSIMGMVAGVTLASLLGSAHCAGMCGAFIAIALAPAPGTTPTPAWMLQALYHAGRLMSYLLLGAAAGLIGRSLDLGASIAGVQHAALALAAGTLVIFGSVALLRIWGVRVPRAPLPEVIRRFAGAGHRVAMNLPAPARAGMIGLLTTLLPCGWLYAFVLVAAGTGSAPLGSLVMLAFWIGTLPVLIALGSALRLCAGPIGRRLPTLTALVLIAVGAWTLLGRAALLRPGDQLASDPPDCCASGARP